MNEARRGVCKYHNIRTSGIFVSHPLRHVHDDGITIKKRDRKNERP